MILVLIFAKALRVYGLIIGIQSKVTFSTELIDFEIFKRIYNVKQIIFTIYKLKMN